MRFIGINTREVMSFRNELFRVRGLMIHLGGECLGMGSRLSTVFANCFLLSISCSVPYEFAETFPTFFNAHYPRQKFLEAANSDEEKTV